MKKIVDIKFESDKIIGITENGEEVAQSLIWYPRLRNATPAQRQNYTIGLDGIHWREIDEDISFESFFYKDAEPTILQRFFLMYPEINASAIAKRLGLTGELLNNYIRGDKTPSAEREREIIKRIRHLGEELVRECNTALIERG